MKIRLELFDDNYAHASIALRLLNRFKEEFPDRVGFSDGVVYTTKCGCLETHDLAFYTYRTPKGTLVVRQC